MWSRRTFLFTSTAAMACWSAPPEPDVVGPAIRSGAAWLWGKHGSHGTFQSEVYGLLSSGDSLTPFCLDALLAVAPIAPPPPERLPLALEWMMAAQTEGALGFGGVAVDYPVYATALMVRCLAAAKPEGWRTAVDKSVAWLRSQQYTDAWGDSPAVGGFGMGSRVTPTPPHVAHVDLSMSRRAIEALVAAGVPATDPSLVLARRFVEGCRAPDGGFVYSPAQPVLNKGAAGYGSATTDGILALRALGADTTADTAWLAGIHLTAANPRADSGPYEGYGEAMRGYYRAGAARVFAAGGGPGGWRKALAAAIVAEQATDGSWTNPSPLQKEDDPLIATGFALKALAAL
jgi:hypothetical protein